MIGTNRIIVNTIAQYTRTIVNMVLAFVATRVILKSLGVEDYGIYTVVAGAVSLLSFLTNSLIITTQRFLSVEQGKENDKKSRIVFNNSLILHVLITISVLILLELLSLLLFNGLLNIPKDRIFQSQILYQFVALVLCLTFLSSPYRAVLISHENIVYISIVEIFDSVFKLLIAYSLLYVDSYKLILYGALLACIQLFNLLALGLYSLKNYKESRQFRYQDFSPKYLRLMFAFAGWTMYNLVCNVGRVQGIAIGLNKTCGSTINASYGIAFQVSGALSSLSVSLQNAINPQLMKAEGSGDRKAMLRFSEMESKFSFFLMSAIAVPTIFEIERLLQIWLVDVPEYASLFCQMVIIASMCDSLTVGLGAANQAIGKIRNYTIIICTIKLLTLPVVICLLMTDCSMGYVSIIYILFELISSLMRIPILHYSAGLSYCNFFKRVLIRELIPLTITCFICIIVVSQFNYANRFIITFIVSISFFLISIYLWGLEQDEKVFLGNIIKRLLKLFRI